MNLCLKPDCLSKIGLLGGKIREHYWGLERFLAADPKDQALC